ncbi:family 78 glycoside hydrolase catalytic domain [Flavobacteriaceae bacterium TP-CH-4]|uniref:Family 78 glycoside hydrolase catalytic domain n=1 Tax=Pelagihabitans pacificus TaxID=2696054 RepID=A0A967AWZ2_9FLAO|nr:alpha-L-rhamnosidase C-terminal domain-containing protein [Pelagihabitans pacificus]NHF60688.1 family 78 glycoside hydrolase catalytic domain [Pelagihabitans pacificus]
MRYILLVSLFLSFLEIHAQSELNFPDIQYGIEQIKANWVSHPDIQGGEDRVILFRNVFTVHNSDQDFIINISADNHYFLYVNGSFVTHGPQLGDMQHWKFESLNLKGLLKNGKNIIAVKVVNYGKKRFLGFQSLYTALMVNGVTENAKMLTTKGPDDGWKCVLDNSYKASEVHWRSPGENRIIGGFYANNPTDYITMKHHPKGWEQPEFDDSAWQKNSFYESTGSMGGSIAYLLEPRNLPLLTWEQEGVGTIVRSQNIGATSFPTSGNLRIPANIKASFLIDKKVVTSGFPELSFSGGKGASIKIRYAENLFGPKKEKGDRNQIEGKELIGYFDHVLSDGSPGQQFLPTWMRTFRFIQLDIETGPSELVLDRLQNYRSRTTLASTATFTSDNGTYNEIFAICKRTVDLCTQDYFLSDAYYETMQYIGDTKVHALIWQALSGSLAHTENALRQFHHSRDAEGNLLGAYPLRSTFIFPTYSLIWVDMVADHYALTGDTTIIEKYKAGIAHTLNGFEKNMKSNHLVDRTRYRYFVDWYQNPDNGGGTATKNGGENSAVVSLHYAHALMNAANLFEAAGDTHQAAQFADRANEIKGAVYELCYDSDRKLFAERPDKSVYDQHTNIMAILTDAIAPSEQKSLLNSILQDKSLLQATYYYRFYLFEAIKKVGVPELFDLAQQPWEKMVADHMTTTLERFESTTKPTRSEVHPWSASPAYFYLTYLAGIQSKENNFEEIRIAPVFGILQTIEGSMPTTKGTIHFNLKRSEGRLFAEIVLPENIKGEIIWNGTTETLRPGRHQYELNQ